MTTSLKPVGNKLIIEKIENTKSDSTIVLIDNNNQDHFLGKVLKIGAKVESTCINEGDHVWFSKFSGTEVKENIFVITADDILAIDEAVA